MKKIVTLAIVATLVILTILAIQFLPQAVNKQLTTQISPQSNEQQITKRIVGFLPYWQVTSIDKLDFHLLDEVIYFGLHVSHEGEIVEHDSDGNKDLGFSRLGSTVEKLKDKAKETHTAISVGIILQDNEKIETFLKDSNAQERLSQHVLDLIAQYKLDGVNLDFEYSGIPGDYTVAAYASFVEQIVLTLKRQNPHLIISVDATADAIRKSRLYDVDALAKTVDYVILMGYDFYRPASSVAGPVAPLTGKELYEYDVTTAVSDFLTVVPGQQLVLGVPYYGWDFPTETEERGSFVEKRPDEAVALSTYRRNRRLLDEQNPKVFFDEGSQTPWMIYRDPDTNGIRQVWFENEVSLGKKYELVNRESLAGIAIWALGYDGDHNDLWDLLGEKFRQYKN